MAEPPITPPPSRSRATGGWLVGVVVAILLGLGLLIWTSGWQPWRRPATPVRAAAPVAAAPAGVAVAAPPATDLSTLATREATLAGQLAALEARTATVVTTAASASGQASRAENLLIAFAVRRAVERGAPLGYLEEQLRRRFGGSQPRAVAAVIAAAQAPVTPERLREGLDEGAADLVTGTAQRGWVAGLGRELAGLVVIRKVGTPSPRPADRLARARRLVDAGDVAAALQEVERLPGAGAAVAWRQAAQRYVVARRALDILEATAITQPIDAAPPTVPAPPSP